MLGTCCLSRLARHVMEASKECMQVPTAFLQFDSTADMKGCIRQQCISTTPACCHQQAVGPTLCL
jgi:hypothetical protein